MLFSDTTVVVHISGNKENSGRILKTNQGLTKVFGYNKTELMGHQVNTLMPSIYAMRHNDFLEKFYRTGHKIVFNNEQTFYGLHRNGFCFCVKIFVKQMPDLQEGIQYVGMIKEQRSDHEFILTNSRGVIDSFSERITSLLNLPASLFKETDINIQILAPELIEVFGAGDRKKALLNKFREPGGRKLTFITPKHLGESANLGNKRSQQDVRKESKAREGTIDDSNKEKVLGYRYINKILNKQEIRPEKKITSADLLNLYEYKDSDDKQTVKCEIIDLSYGEEFKDLETLKLRVFKIAKIGQGPLGIGMEQGSEYMDDIYDPEYSIHSNKEVIDENAKHHEKKNLPGFVANNRDENLVRLGIKAQDERPQTLSTEKLPNNLVTTEGRQETLEAKYGSKDKGMKIVSEESSDQGEERHAEENKFQFKQKDTDNDEFKIKNEDSDEAGTPRIGLGEIKGPRFGNHDAPAIKDLDSNSQANESLLEYSLKEARDEEKKKVQRKFIHAKSSKVLTGANTNKGKQKVQSKPGTEIDNENTNTLQARLRAMKKKSEIQNMDNPNEVEEAPPEIITMDLKNENVIRLINLPIRRLESAEDKKRKRLSSPHNKVDFEDEQLRLIEIKVRNDKSDSELGKDLKKDLSARNELRGSSSKVAADSTINRIGRPQRTHKSRMVADDNYEPEKAEFNEYKFTEEELKLRKSLYDSIVKKTKEKKKEEKKELGKKEEDEEEKENKENSEEDSEKDEEQSNKETAEVEELHSDQDITSSMESVSKSSAARSYYSLRAAIDEKFIPSSIHNMSYIGQLVFLLILALSIIDCVFTIVRYNNMRITAENINHSSNRLGSLINIKLHVTNMMIISSNYLHDGNIIDDDTLKIFDETTVKLKYEADRLKEAQTQLSMATNTISASAKEKVNPAELYLNYMPINGMESAYANSIWQALIEMVVCAYRIANMKVGTVDPDTDPTVYLLVENALNSIIVNLDPAPEVLQEDIENRKARAALIFLILLIVASVSLFFSTILLMPVVNKIKKNKQNVFELFMHVKKHKANNELKRCKKFTIDNQIGQDIEIMAVEDEEEMEEVDTTNDQLKKLQSVESYKTKKRGYKRLVLNLGIIIFKFIFLILIMEGYFILSYFLSMTFLSRTLSLISELNKLMSRMPTNSLLLVMQK